MTLHEIDKRSMNISSSGIPTGFADPSLSSGSEGGRAAAGPGDASSDVMLMGGYDQAEIPDGMGSLVGNVAGDAITCTRVPAAF
jgi:hypothetical protein